MNHVMTKFEYLVIYCDGTCKQYIIKERAQLAENQLETIMYILKKINYFLLLSPQYLYPEGVEDLLEQSSQVLACDAAWSHRQAIFMSI